MTASVPLRRARILGELRPGRLAPVSGVTVFTLLVLIGTAACEGPLDTATGMPARPVMAQIRERGVLRVGTVNAPTSFYTGAHGPEGLDHDLAVDFSHRLRIKLDLITFPDRGALRAALRERRIDLAAAHLSFDASWTPAGVGAEPHMWVSQFWVYRRGAERPQTVADLARKRLVVMRGSVEDAYLLKYPAAIGANPRLSRLARSPEGDGFDAVSAGRADFALVDAHEFAFARPLHPDIAIGFEAGLPRPVQWVVRSDGPDLKSELDAFVVDQRRGGALQRRIERSLAPARRVETATAREFDDLVESRLPALQMHFEHASVRTGLDWRLLAALAYQESQWNPRAESPQGAQGIMMLMPELAANENVRDPFDPRASILAGARHLLQVRDRLPSRIAEPDRTWMAIAAYNAGSGHLEDARIVTQLRGANPDRWVDVRESLPLLAEPGWYLQLRNGYARGWEAQYTVDRVRQFADVLTWRSTERHVVVEAGAGTLLSETVVPRK